jgi:sugar phosphate isomerase/epimerase
MNERMKIAVVLSVVVLGAVQITVGQMTSSSGPTTSSARLPGETTAAYTKRLAAESSRRRFGEDPWKLGMQAYSFNQFTFEEAVAKTKALGMRYIEVYPGQTLSKEKPDVKTDHNMSGPDRQLMMQMLREAGVKLMNYGVVGLSNNEAECRKVFDFARETGIETIVSEPPEDAFDLIDRLCEEYKINVAIHNHPKPSYYWDSETVLKVCKGRSRRIGACADTGHWMRSELNPLEQIKKLEGRIISLHFKDLDQGHDVIWGTGKCDAKAILAELKRQKFQGVFSIEYEYNWLNSMPEIAGCVSFFERTEAELGLSDWKWVFNGKDLSGWDGDPRLWSVKDGVIRGETTAENPAKGNTFIIWRDGKLKDFELMLKFRIQNGNSGVQYRSKEVSKWVISGYQAEVENSPGKVGFLYHEAGRGSLVNVGDIMVIDKEGNKNVIGNVSDKDELIKAGYYNDKDWNEYHIIAQGNHLTHYLNGYPTMQLIDFDRLTDPGDPKDTKGAAKEGLLALQIHAGPPMVVEFKDIRIKELPPKYDDAVVLFNGKDLDNWVVNGDKNKSKWVAGKAAMSSDDPKQLVNKGGSGEMINLAVQHGDSLDIYSTEKFGDCRIELEVMVPKGSNSGIYVMGEYEIQVLDSWDSVKMGGGDMGAVYGASPPQVNATRRPGEWQKYVIDFKAPKFDASGKKVENAELVRVELNGEVIHKENLVLAGQTPGGIAGKEAATGPLMFQGNHGPVAYRNIIVKPLRK